MHGNDSTYPRIQLDPNEWAFIGEGNLQLIFRYKIKCDPNEGFSETFICVCSLSASCRCARGFHGKILKIRKSKSTNYYLQFTDYVRNVVYPWFSSRALATSRVVIRLNPDFLHPFNDLVGDRNIDILRLDLLGIIEKDFSHINRVPTQLIRHRHYLSVEIKVKSGLTSCSDLVRPNNDIKFQLGRFQLMQLYKSGNYPLYDPCDLCSMNRRRVSNSINCLLQHHPQYVKICLDGDHVYGWKKYSTEKENLIRNLSYFVESVIPIQHLQLFLEYLLVEIVTENKLFSEIQLMQGLDFVDIEGVSYIYDRLRDMIQDDCALHEAIEQRMSQPLMNKDYVASMAQYLNQFRNSRQMPGDSRYFENIDTKSALIPPFIWMRDCASSRSFSNTRSQLFREWIDRLDVQECLNFVHLWMVALAAKDLSVLSTFEITEYISINSQPSHSFDLLFSTIEHILPTSESAGHLVLLLSRNDSNRTIPMCQLTIQYQLGITDIGPKDLSKLWEKDLEEDSLCAAVSRALNYSSR